MGCALNPKTRPESVPDSRSSRQKSGVLFSCFARHEWFPRTPAKVNPSPSNTSQKSVDSWPSLEEWEANSRSHQPLCTIMNMQMMDYFARQTAVQEVGINGLKRMQSAKVTIVGAGGVGSSAAYFLASQGIGHLKLIDQDIVEESNLHRLLGMEQGDLHMPKAEALARKLNSRHPWTRTEAIVETLRAGNAGELLE